jgi:hypothetical protein
MKQMGVDESDVKRLVRRTVTQLPPSMRDTVQLDQAPEVFRAGASWGLRHVLAGYNEAFRTVTPDEAGLLLPALRAALKDKSIPVRLNAAGCLGAFDSQSSEARELCLLALKDENAGVRFNAIYALWKIFMDEKKLRQFLHNSLRSFESARRDEALKNLDLVIQPYSSSPSSSQFE